jgi:hypothetical protein
MLQAASHLCTGVSAGILYAANTWVSKHGSHMHVPDSFWAGPEQLQVALACIFSMHRANGSLCPAACSSESCLLRTPFVQLVSDAYVHVTAFLAGREVGVCAGCVTDILQ